jgi:hypothetical protein
MEVRLAAWIASFRSRALASGGRRPEEWLVSYTVDVALVTEDLQGKGPSFVIRDAGVVRMRTDASTIGEAIATAIPRRQGSNHRERNLHGGPPAVAAVVPDYQDEA